ncbi:hypothetical protein TPHA_0B03890 [Tetrapisispora phaffii CBS 4417]|uniref:Uncharacterized protein n=1 Tax=Tetrapisispora phaffii (strain ATCC 24235 / CBS 4417 / NBRC 1672 / NRRL Y-8282 / UCD 70-5) TaxID=1071381 RepID=G8BPY0_TETPH|nr:hypothetical protein TPHA_0B03890 [Tetrapisispora phaffii CBS 4417]CCE62061.1 hypothetical protein TPHA_0B03890 [Tetrapisispora phaffii CBS 4417]
MTNRNIIIADFDETITYDDTIAVLSKLPYFVRSQAYRSSNNKCQSNAPLKSIPDWEYFVNYYMEVYSKNINSIKRKLPILEFDQNNTRVNYLSKLNAEIQYQDELKELIELKSVDNIVNNGTFAGISIDDLKNYLKSLDQNGSNLIRKEFKHYIFEFRKANKDENNLYIISINWSKEFIYNLINGIHDKSKDETIKLENIYCNDLLLDHSNEEFYTGDFSRNSVTGSDKFRILNNLSQKYNASGKLLWFVGDSETDLLSILQPDVNGILLLDPSSSEKNKVKFLKIVRNLLNANNEVIKNYIQNENVQFVKLFEKYKGSDRYVYLAKNWNVFVKLII